MGFRYAGRMKDLSQNYDLFVKIGVEKFHELVCLAVLQFGLCYVAPISHWVTISPTTTMTRLTFARFASSS